MRIHYAEHVKLIHPTAKSVQVSKTCSALVGLGVDIRLTCLRGSGTIEQVHAHYGLRNHFPIRRLPAIDIRYLGSMWYRAQFAAAIAFGRQDLVYTRDLGTAVAAGWLGQPFMYEMHSMPVRRQQEWMLRKVCTSPRLVAVTAITQALAGEVVRRYGPSPERVHVIACSADPPEARKSAPVSTRSSDTLRVGYVGHLYEGKGGGMIAGLASRHPEMEFHIVGEIAEPALEAKLPANVVRHGIKSHVDAMALLQSFDCALAPYSARTQAVDGKVISDWFSPLKIFEYLAHSVPVVSSDLPVIGEILTADDTALLVDPGNLDAWSLALARLRDEPELRKALAIRGRTLIERSFSYRRRAEAIVAIAESFLAGQFRTA